MDRHRVLREVLRNYLVFEEYFKQHGKHVISHKGLEISFLDLQDSLKNLSPRKKEALYYNVIMDWKQKDVAKRMNITTVSVGQYVEQACLQVADWYFDKTEGL